MRASHLKLPRASRTQDASLESSRRDDRAVERALRILENRVREPGPLMTKRSFVAEWFRLRLGSHEREVFAVAWLDVRHRLIEFRELFAGTIDRTEVHLREVVKSALACNAAAAIFAHNHPSGYAEPSQLDIELTEYLQVNLGALGVMVLDHLVVTKRLAVSVYGNFMKIRKLQHPTPNVADTRTAASKRRKAVKTCVEHSSVSLDRNSVSPERPPVRRGQAITGQRAALTRTRAKITRPAE